jgi:hypothetical protein
MIRKDLVATIPMVPKRPHIVLKEAFNFGEKLETVVPFHC